MGLIRSIDQTEYPETDGKPMGETDLHIDWMVRIRDILRWRYRGQRVYVASNLIVYYEEGTPSKFVVPDNFVVLDCDPQRRRTYRLWEEQKAPDVVFEVTSRSTKREDETFKPQAYARIGVGEYFLYDPGAEYLDPPLQGFRLERQAYRWIEPNDDDGLTCQRLGMTLRREDGKLVFYDIRSGEFQFTEAEAERAAHLAEQAAREVERLAREKEQAGREAAEAQVAQLQAELDRLRAELKNSTKNRRSN